MKILILCLFLINHSYAEMKGQTLRETISVKVDGQRTIKLTTDELPILSSLQPILVIIPAKKYLTNGAIFEQVAREASARGIFVV